MNDYELIRNHLRDINESISCLWDGATPVYSNLTSTLKLVYDKTDSSIKILINKKFWDEVNNHDRCFLITHCLLKVIFSHKKRSGFLSDKKCAAIASNITINERIIATYKMIYSEMTILKKLCFIKNTIPDDYTGYIDNDYSMEFIFTLLLYMTSKGILPHNEIIIDYDTSQEDLINNNPNLENNSVFSSTTSIDPESYSNINDDFGDSDSPKNSGEKHSEEKENYKDSVENKNYLESGSDMVKKISEIISDNISKRMVNSDFPASSEINNESDYLELATESILDLTKMTSDANDMDSSDMISARTIGSLAKEKYLKKVESAKKLKLKKILQKKMLRSDDLEDDEQFIYRDEFLYGVDDKIRIPSIKSIGENKKNKKNIILYIDTSGSCKRFSENFVKKVISLKLSDVKLRVFSFDDTVTEVKLKGKSANIKTTFRGTSFYSVVKHSNELILSGEIDKHSLFLVLTDGIDMSFKDENKNKIRSKNQWYWFLTSRDYKTNIDSNCGNVMDISDFI